MQIIEKTVEFQHTFLSPSNLFTVPQYYIKVEKTFLF